MPLLELPHWLIIAGALLVLVGLTGLAFGRRKQAEHEPELLPGDLDAWKAEQHRSEEHSRSAA
jgi:LPXTG-motif cell wall-anchored protein